LEANISTKGKTVANAPPIAELSDKAKTPPLTAPARATHLALLVYR